MRCTYNLLIVTGAPGSGKSTTLAAFLSLRTTYLAFDMDWLLDVVSKLSGSDIRFAPSLWNSYNRLWLEVLHGIVRNNAVPVLFAPISPADLAQDELPKWCKGVEWLLLDCSDKIRHQRLETRSNWNEQLTSEAILDAQSLRLQISESIDTSWLPPNAVAEELRRWVHGKAG